MAAAWQSRYYRRRMVSRSRKITWLVVAALLLAALSGGYAWYRSYVAQQLGIALNNWILARTTEGYGIAADIAPESGTLTAVTRRLSDVTIAAPGFAWTLQLRNLDILVSPLSPFSVEFQADGWAELGYTVGEENYLLTNDFHNGAAGFSYDREGRITVAYLRESGARLDGPISMDFDSFEARLNLDPAAPPAEDGKSVELNAVFENATVTKTGPLPLGNLIQHGDLAAYATGTLRPGRPVGVARGLARCGRRGADSAVCRQLGAAGRHRRRHIGARRRRCSRCSRAPRRCAATARPSMRWCRRA